MVRKSKNEKMEQKVKELEAEALKKAREESEYRMEENHTAELIKADQQPKQENEEHTVTNQTPKDFQSLLQTILDSIGGEVFVKDTNGKYLFVNKAFGKDFGVDPNDVIGKDDYFVFSPEAASKLQENDKRIMASKKAENIEESGVAEGRHITYLTNKVPLIDDHGNVLGICGVGLNVSRQKEMEKELKEAQSDLERKIEERTAQLSETVDKLRETESRYRTVADFTYDWEYWANPDGTLQYVSPSCERISGHTPQQFMDNPSLSREIIIPEDQDVWEKHYHYSRNELKVREIQFRIRRRDGSIRWIEHTCQPVIGNQGAFLGFRASNRDITEKNGQKMSCKRVRKT